MYLEELYNKLDEINTDYSLPESWKEIHDIDENLQKYYKKAFKDILESSEDRRSHNHLSIVQLYLQHFSAYSHTGDPRFDKASLLKTIPLLKIFKQSGFNSIMLLPHFMRSERFKKGDKGSPYSVKDYYTIDPSLKDEIIPDCQTDTLFGAFIEAAHKMGIKVFIDMVPRTAARDSLWILENPEWFYWVRPENTDRLVELLKTPIKDLGPASSMSVENINTVLDNLPMHEILDIFEYAPSVSYPEKWERFKIENKDNTDFLDKLVEEFNLITPPCTSDCVNDPQPAWTDVTPLRLFQDYSHQIMDKFSDSILERPPFFIQPVLKASNFPGKVPLDDLWNKIAEIPHYYIDKYHVDGLRGDMFHALPSKLIEKMTQKIPDKKGFTLIMENLDNKAGNDLSIEHGFDYYTGNLFAVIEEGAHSMDYYLNQITGFKTAILNMPVIGDSVPILSRNREKALFQIALSAFIPNGAFGVTADTIIENKLPLNYGLGFSDQMQRDFNELLIKDDRTLSYFNYDCMNREWSKQKMELIDFFKELNSLREEIFSEDIAFKLSKINHEQHSLTWEMCSEKNSYIIHVRFEDEDQIQIDNTKIIYSLNIKQEQEIIKMKPYSIIVERIII